MSEKKKNCMAGIFLFFFALLYLVFSHTIQRNNIDRLVGSKLFPQICGVIMLIGSLCLIIHNIRKKAGNFAEVSSTKFADDESYSGRKPNYINTILVLFSFLVYIILLSVTGFVIATFLYLVSQMILLEIRSKKKRYFFYVICSAITTGVVYLLFTSLFHLILPRGFF